MTLSAPRLIRRRLGPEESQEAGTADYDDDDHMKLMLIVVLAISLAMGPRIRPYIKHGKASLTVCALHT